MNVFVSNIQLWRAFRTPLAVNSWWYHSDQGTIWWYYYFHLYSFYRV